MKKSFLVTILVIFVSFLSYIQPSQAKADEPRTFIGTIESFRPTFARPPKWPIARFTAIADNGEKIEVYVLQKDTTVTDVNGKSIENKRPQVGKKVEIKYSTGEHEIYGGQRYEAISIRYLPANYVPQPSVATPPSTPQANVPAQSNSILVGKVVKGGVTFSLRCPYRFVIVTDNGERIDIWIPRDGLTITDLNGKAVYGAPPRAGKKMEIKYLIGDNGQHEAVSMRYVPADYVPRPAAQTTSAQAAQGTSAQPGDTFVGTIESFPCGVGHFKSGPPLWPIGMIVVTGNNGEKNNFLIVNNGPNATAFYDADGKAVPILNNIKTVVGKRVEVKYAVTAESMRYANKQIAISVRYVPADYVAQTTVSTVPSESMQSIQQTTPKPENVFIGTIDRLFSLDSMVRAVPDKVGQYMYFKLKGAALTDVDGKVLSWENLTKGQKVEVKYSQIIGTGASGAKTAQAVSLRTIPNDFIPADYVQQPTASTTSVKPSGAMSIPGTISTFAGRIGSSSSISGMPPNYFCKFTITNDSGESKEIYVLRTTTFMDFKGRNIGVLQPARGLKAEIKYTVGQSGQNEAISVRFIAG